ncbi:MAG: PhzF family phenazine biosynthesis protein [Hyphomicrobiaceae bacterium]
MMQLKFYTLDVFTETRFGGNPLAVVMNADALPAGLMQSIARELNLSETVFVQKATNPAAWARVRIFTPAVELPFAGHPTIGTGILLAQLRAGEASPDQDALVVLEETIGAVRVGVRLRSGKAPYAEFDAPKLPEAAGDAPSAERLAAALGLMPSEIGFANHRPSQWSAGVPFTFVPIASMAAIARAEIVSTHWGAAFGTAKSGKVYLYTRETVHTTSSFHARMFGPAAGVAEDPATGSAAAAFAGAINAFDQPLMGTHKRMIEQGFEMGRPSLVALSFEVAARGKLDAVRIGGSAVRVTEGQLEI